MNFKSLTVKRKCEVVKDFVLRSLECTEEAFLSELVDTDDEQYDCVRKVKQKVNKWREEIEAYQEGNFRFFENSTKAVAKSDEYEKMLSIYVESVAQAGDDGSLKLSVLKGKLREKSPDLTDNAADGKTRRFLKSENISVTDGIVCKIREVNSYENN
jgi:hypothetical protein